MQEFFGDSLFFGMAISVLGYELGRRIKAKWKLAIFNPLLIAVIFVMVVLKALGISYDSYNNSAKYLSYLLTPVDGLAWQFRCISRWLCLERTRRRLPQG